MASEPAKPHDCNFNLGQLISVLLIGLAATLANIVNLKDGSDIRELKARVQELEAKLAENPNGQ